MQSEKVQQQQSPTMMMNMTSNNNNNKTSNGDENPNPNIPHDPLIEKKRHLEKQSRYDESGKLIIDDNSNLDAFEEFDGLVQLDLDMLLPKSYFDAIDELSERIGMTVKEWINYAVIKEINSLKGLSNHYLYSPVNGPFLAKYNIGQLKDSTIQHIVKRYATFSMEEVELKR